MRIREPERRHGLSSSKSELVKSDVSTVEEKKEICRGSILQMCKKNVGGMVKWENRLYKFRKAGGLSSPLPYVRIIEPYKSRAGMDLLRSFSPIPCLKQDYPYAHPKVPV